MEYLKIEQWSFTSDSMEDWKKNDKHRWDITVNGIINDSKCEKNLSFLIKKKIVDCFCHTHNSNHKVDSQVKIPSFQRIPTQNQFSSAR